MSEAWIQYVLAAYGHSPVCAWQNFLVIPNCESVTWWECDLLSVSKAGYCTEVEIKCTLSDWKADEFKGKHSEKDETIIKKFYYAGPEKLMSRYSEVWTRPGSGIIGIELEETRTRPKIHVLREAVADKRARRLTDKEIMRLGRTAMVRYWTWCAESRHPDFMSTADEIKEKLNQEIMSLEMGEG